MIRRNFICWQVLAILASAALAASPPLFAQLSEANLNDYNQWKLALEAGGVASPVAISAPPGYAVEMIRQAKPGEGSWITLAFDPKGRIVVAREDKGLLRMTLDDERQRVSPIASITRDLLECRSGLFAHNSLYVSANNSLGIYRLKDSRSDGVYDDVKL